MADSLNPTPVSTAAETSNISATSASSVDAVSKKRFLGRTVTVRQLLGDGVAADLMLWSDKKRSATFLLTVIALWLLFEVSGFSVVTILADVFMVLITVVFIWSQICTLLKRDPPKFPDYKLSAEHIMEFAEAFCNEVNVFLQTAQRVALGNDYILFAKIMALLYASSLFGSWFNGLTLTLITFVLAFTVPYFYNKHEEQVDVYLEQASAKAHGVYKDVEIRAKDVIGQVHGKIQERVSAVKKKDQ